jgi:hypothetical protein
MGDLTFEDLEKDPWQQSLIASLETRYGKPLPDGLKNLLINVVGNAQQRASQKLKWIQSTAYITERITSNKAHPAEYPLFWIRLWSIIREYGPKIQCQRALYEGVAWAKPELEAVDALVKLFSGDDLLFIEFMRHHHAHMHMDALQYRTSPKKDGTIKVIDPHSPDSLGLARKMLSESDWDQQEVAFKFASRLKKAIMTLAEVVMQISNLK